MIEEKKVFHNLEMSCEDNDINEKITDVSFPHDDVTPNKYVDNTLKSVEKPI